MLGTSKIDIESEYLKIHNQKMPDVSPVYFEQYIRSRFSFLENDDISRLYHSSSEVVFSNFYEIISENIVKEYLNLGVALKDSLSVFYLKQILNNNFAKEITSL